MIGNQAGMENDMRVYIELRRGNVVRNWAVLAEEDATTEAIAARVQALAMFGMDVGDTITVYESNMTPAQLKLVG